MMNISIDVDIDNRMYILKGDLKSILINKSLMLRLKRLNYKNNIDTNSSIEIPFDKETEIKVLESLKKILQQLNFTIEISQSINEELSNYQRDTEQFKIFSDNARKIRNNEFKDNPKLTNQFYEFQSVIKKELKRTLYPLQLLSAFHMAFSQNSCNFSVPGAGKTSIVYAAYTYLKKLPKDNSNHIDKIMVIGPLSSFAPWENEYRKCFDKELKSFRMSGNGDKEKKLQHLYSSNPAELTLIFHGSVPTFESDIVHFLRKHKTLVVVDEAHRIKNPEGIWGTSAANISKEAKARIALTGTPIPNGYQDLYNLYKFIYPFKYKEILDAHYGNLEDMTANSKIESNRVQSFKSNISPYFIRIKKQDLNLPEVKEEIICCEMDIYQREIYDFIESKYIADFKQNGSATVKDILNKAKLIRLRQACTNPALLIKPLKNSLENGEYIYDPNNKFTTNDNVIVNDSEFFKKIR